MLNSKEIKLRIDRIRGNLTIESPEPVGDDLEFLKKIGDDGRKSVITSLESLRKYVRKLKEEKRRLCSMFAYEEELWKHGTGVVIGVDEAGRGPLAGPVVAAAVIFPKKIIIEGLNDSKKVKESDRERIYEILMSDSRIKIGIGMVSNDVIDKINILNGTMLAMRYAIEELRVENAHLLVDGMILKGVDFPQTKIIKGDSKSASIASASIIAKVTRDRIMKRMSEKFPQWNFDIHKGYGTSDHLKRLRKYGPSPIHRISFKGVK
jgi:ribonuclease HII